MSIPWQACGYGCGKPWRPAHGTRLRGHARCAVPVAFMDELLVVAERFPRLTDARVAEDMGVTVAVVRAWMRWALERRRRGLTTIAR